MVVLADYFKKPESLKAGQPVDDLRGWGVADNKTLWSYEMLVGIKKDIEAAGLRWEAIENFDLPLARCVAGRAREGPADGGPQAHDSEHRQGGYPHHGVQLLYRRSCRAPVPAPCSRWGRGARDGRANDPLITTPLQKGMVWNMIYE
jgi:mannonate dehydratase